MRFFDNRATTTPYLTLLASCLVFFACGGEKPTTSLDDGGPVQSMDSGPNVCTLNCDDGIMCTDDLLNKVACTCGHLPLHARCSVGQICDLQDGCVEAPPCAKDEDCPEPDDFCIVATCNQAVAACQYDPLDKDKDGYPPLNCTSVGGSDCDDTASGFYTHCNIDQPCEDEEDDCIWCPMGAVTYPSASEFCDLKDNDCNGEIDDIPEIGMPCDSDWDEDLCEDGVWECSNDDFLFCTDDYTSNQEVCDGQDNDCDGEVDEGVLNACGQCGPVPQEVCDGIDNNCDMQADEGLLSICDGTTDRACVNGVNHECDCCDEFDNDADNFVDGFDEDCGEHWCATNDSNAPNARSGHSAIWTGEEMIIWGGFADEEGYINTGGRYNPITNSWTTMSTNNAPSARSGHSAIWTGEEMIVWGGEFWGDYGYDTNPLNSGGRYNPVTNSWMPVDIATAPNARSGHSAIWTGTEMIIWGGQDSSGSELNTGARYNSTLNNWTALPTTNSLLGRSGHTSIWTGTEMIVWGGLPVYWINDTGSRYNPSTDFWTTMSVVNAPSGWIGHSAIWTSLEIVVWGGWDGYSTSNYDTGSRYNPSTDSWTTMNMINVPSARAGHTAIWTSEEMIIWGGLYEYDYIAELLNTGSRYNPFTDSWTTANTTNAPNARVGHTAIWTDEEMIIWGGCEDISCQNRLNTGGRYFPPQ